MKLIKTTIFIAYEHRIYIIISSKSGLRFYYLLKQGVLP